MSDNEHAPNGAQANGEHADEQAGHPHRVIGTPAPSQAHRLLGEARDPAEHGPPPGVIYPDEAKAKKAERIIALLFLLAFVAGIGFFVAFFEFPRHDPGSVRASNITLGLGLTVALLALAVGVTLWVRRIMPHYEMTEEREELASGRQTREAFAAQFAQGVDESGILKRPLLRRTLLLAAAPIGLAPLLLAWGLGPLPRKQLRYTAWKKGTRLVLDGTGAPIKAADFDSPGGIITVAPEGKQDDLDVMAKAAVLLIKLRPDELELPADKMNWTVNGIVAYSKICTHVGCPAALYERTTNRILCPCHQSTFDATRGAKVIFGPAARPLPQLPITVDSEGYLVAQSDFHEPVGPSFWERGGSN